ncbi:MAG: acetylglutamate kinase, partial [Clostridia bacterium]|nr:acetylglutamate kinase [Clostridia bacterium]
EKAAVLVEALPYIRRFRGKTVVVKYGGHAMAGDLEEAVLKDLVLMKFVGMQPVLVHGGGPAISGWLARLGIESRFVDGLRVTDRDTVEVVQMVLAGRINKDLVARLQALGARGVGLCGIDGGLFLARRQAYVDRSGTPQDLGFVGEIAAVAPEIVTSLAEAGYIPVVASVAADEAGVVYNVNADLAAGALAAALGAAKLILLTDVPGILREPGRPETLFSVLTAADLRRLVAEGVVTGGMIPKAEACLQALAGGVEEAHILDGRRPHALLLEVFTERGVGTMITGGGST